MNRTCPGKAYCKKKEGLRKPLVQELRLMSGSSYDLRSLADRFLRTADTAGFDLVAMNSQFTMKGQLWNM